MQYLLTIHQPDGGPPPREVMEKVGRVLHALNQELKPGGARTRRGARPGRLPPVPRDPRRLLRRLARGDEARTAYDAAIGLSDNEAEREFRRRQSLAG